MLYDACGAGSQGKMDEFGELNDFSRNAPNHRYKERYSLAQNQWYFFVVGVEGGRLKTWIWSQDGTLSGYYMQSMDCTNIWTQARWNIVRLLAYIEATTEGDSNSYYDIARISVHQSLPALPNGFVIEHPIDGNSPNAPSGLRINN
jgi:hypothetical protein